MVELKDVSAIDSDSAQAEIERLCQSVNALISEAQEGKFGMGGIDVCHALSLMNIEHPDHAQWEPVIQLIAEDAVAVGQKSETIHLLATHAKQVPSEMKKPLSDAVTRIARNEGNVTTLLFDRRDDASAEAVHLAIALDAFDPHEESDQVARLLNGSATERARVAAIAGSFDSPFHRGVLISLASDDDGDVRSSACAWLMVCAASEVDPSVSAALRRAAVDPGRRVPMQLAFGLEGLAASEVAQAQNLADELRAKLAEHASARVRARALASKL
jgi:hypothetical protein